MNAEPDDSRNPLHPLDSREVRTSFATGSQCTARSKRTGDRCKRPAMLGGNVCRAHGGAAPQTRAKALRRLEQASDVLVQRLLSFAVDGDVADNVALAAIRDALDRAGLTPTHALEVSVAPWQQVLQGVARVIQADSRRARGLPPLDHENPMPALDPVTADTVIDAEVVDENPDAAGIYPTPAPTDTEPPVRQPPWQGSEPPHRPSAELATLEDAAAWQAQQRRASTGRIARRVR